MKSLLLVSCFLIHLVVFAQYDDPVIETKQLDSVLHRIEQYPCLALFTTESSATPEQVEMLETIQLLKNYDFQVLDSLLLTEDPLTQIVLFHRMCSDYRSKITYHHLSFLNKETTVSVCGVGNHSKLVSQGELSRSLYHNSRKSEKVSNDLAWKYFLEAQEIQFHGPVNYKKAIQLLTLADSLEPNNPIILSELGEYKFKFETDIDGALANFQRAIDYSMDPERLEIRHFNLGLTYLGMGDLNKACKEWTKSGEHGKRYRHLCMQPFDYGIHENTDSLIQLVIQAVQDTLFITSAHNSPEMTEGELTYDLKNLRVPKMVINDNQLSLGLEHQAEDFYLEAIDSNNRKFRFYTEKEFYFYGDEEKTTLQPGQSFKGSVSYTDQYHFPNPGTYKIRLALRPSDAITGIDHVYYSNWVTVEVVKKYKLK